MSLQLSKVHDPRDNLQKIRRKPLENYMRANFPDDYEPGMPADLMRMILRNRKVFDLPLKKSRLGATSSRIDPEAPPVDESPQQETRAVDSMELLKAEWRGQKFTADMDITLLRKECKARGIKLARTDKRVDMARKLNGENTS